MSVHVLSPEGLRNFLSEVEDTAELISVTPSHSEEGMPLPEARDALLSLRLGGLELRYLSLGKVWRDTIRPTLDGFRLVHQPA